MLTANLGTILFPEIVAEMADFLLRLEGIETVLCLGCYSNDIILSLRTIRHDVNLGEIIKRLVDGMGTAGGHGMMAGGKIDNVPAGPDAISEIQRVVTERLLGELGLDCVAPRNLIEQVRVAPQGR